VEESLTCPLVVAVGLVMEIRNLRATLIELRGAAKKYGG